MESASGKVTAVRPWTSDPTKIEILLEVKQGTPLNEKSVAKLGLVSIMNSAALSITTGSNDAKRLAPGSSIPSKEAASLDEIAGKMADVADNANALITQAQGELDGISGDARKSSRQPQYRDRPAHATEGSSRVGSRQRLAGDRRSEDRSHLRSIVALSQHADDTIQNVNGTVTDVREPVRKDLAELQNTLLQAKQLLTDMQVMVRANDYKIDDTVENLRVATDNLDQLTDSLKQRPVEPDSDQATEGAGGPTEMKVHMRKHPTTVSLVTGSPYHPGRLRRGGEVSELLHAPRAATAGSAGAGKCPRNLGGARISLAYLPSARGHRLQERHRNRSAFTITTAGRWIRVSS